jgi:hypothetical protein
MSQRSLWLFLAGLWTLLIAGPTLVALAKVLIPLALVVGAVRAVFFFTDRRW